MNVFLDFSTAKTTETLLCGDGRIRTFPGLYIVVLRENRCDASLLALHRREGSPELIGRELVCAVTKNVRVIHAERR